MKISTVAPIHKIDLRICPYSISTGKSLFYDGVSSRKIMLKTPLALNRAEEYEDNYSNQFI